MPYTTQHFISSMLLLIDSHKKILHKKAVINTTVRNIFALSVIGTQNIAQPRFLLSFLLACLLYFQRFNKGKQ